MTSALMDCGEWTHSHNYAQTLNYSKRELKTDVKSKAEQRRKDRR